MKNNSRAMTLLKREFDVQRARKAEATRIHQQILRDPVIREMGRAPRKSTLGPITQ